jgi:hypothetical protein
MKKLLLTDWNFIRILRLVLGFLAIGAGVVKQDVLVGGIGGLLIYQAIINMSCGPSGCAVPNKEVSAIPVENDNKAVSKALFQIGKNQK